jgi:hypothetical protein
LFHQLGKIPRQDLNAALKSIRSFCIPDHAGIGQVTQGKYGISVFCEIDLLFKHDRRSLELDAEQLVPRLVVAFQRFLSWQEAVRLHRKFLVAHLHNKWRTQVKQVSIADIGKQDIGKSIRVFSPHAIEIRFPEKINKQRQLRRGFYPVILIKEMGGMDELDMLHLLKIIRFPACSH